MKRKLLIFLIVTVLCFLTFCICTAATENETIENEFPAEALTRQETGPSSGTKYSFSWEYDPDTYTLTIPAAITKECCIARG